MIKVIMVINSGSSSIKFALFNYANLEIEYQGDVKNIHDSPVCTILDKNKSIIFKTDLMVGYDAAFATIFAWSKSLASSFIIVAVGHRVVHGGSLYRAPTKITPTVIENLTKLIPMAPLHQPQNLEAMKIIAATYPQMLQIACFDTAFHSTQMKLATLFAIPRALTEQGIIHYGFHGISYEYIASVLPMHIGDKAGAKVIVAHLGNGASMCALHLQKSVATTMSFTALDGLMMGTRCGSIDPGVLLYLLQEEKYSVEQLQVLLYEQSGLLGVSSYSNDVIKLEQSKSLESSEALDLFCFTAARELGMLVTTLKGCDAIVFTAGIGEHSASIRQGICQWLDWLGVSLDKQANAKNQAIISDLYSKITVAVIPTNEELMIAKHTKNLAPVL
jgi:acetate kinase